METMTMNVTDIKVRYTRKIQPAEYSPIEAEVSMTAQLAEGDNANEVATRLISDAKAAVFTALGAKSTGTTTTKVEAAPASAAPKAEAEAPKKGPGRPPKQTLTPPAEKAAKPAPAEDPMDMVEEAPKAAPAPAPAPAEEPDEFAGMEEPAAAPAMTAKELQDWIGAKVKANPALLAKVKAVYAEFGVARSVDTTEEQRPLIRTKLEAIFAAK
jgi:hypothetical protein